MSSNFKIADLIAFINTASLRHVTSSRLKNGNTNMNIRVLSILERQGVIRGFQLTDNYIEVFFKYKQSMPVFSSLKVVSKPGKRVFWSLNRLALKSNFLSFSGFYIISTSKGLLTSDEALLSKHISGEILIKVVI